MNNSSLLKILGTFSADEIKEFKDFISSPFYNKNKNVIKLFNYLRKFYPEFNDKRLAKEFIHKKLFSNENYNESFIRTAAFNLSKLAEDYLAISRFTKNKIKRGISLLEEFNSRKLGKNFLKLFDQLKEDVSDGKNAGNEFYFNKYQMQLQMEVYMDWSRFMQKDLKSYSESYGEVNDYLTFYYLTKLLNHYRFLNDKHYWLPLDLDNEFTEIIINYLSTNKNKFVEYPKIKVHLYEILLHRERKHEHFIVLKEMLNDTVNLNRSERYSLHNILQSFCTRQNFTGRDEYVIERFALYKTAVEQGLYAASEHLYVDDIFFINAASIASQLGEFEWTKSFITKYKDMLSPENKEIVYNLALSRMLFEKGEFDEAGKSLSSISSAKHILFKFPIRDLSLMLNYELSDFEQLAYQTDSYRHFIKKNRDSHSEERQERINNFLKYFTKLYKLKENFDKSEIIGLEEELIRVTNIMERKWLLKKTSELLS